MNMMQTTHQHNEHREVWLNLPWYVNDSIDQQQRERIDAHLQGCAECRAELAQQRGIHSAMSADAGVHILPSASLARLRQRLDAQQSQQAAQSPQQPAAANDWQRRLLMAAAVAGVAVTLGVVMVTATTPLKSGESTASYRTVSSEAARPAQESIRAVFAPDTTVARMQKVLEGAQLRIIAGPSEAGVYSLALTGDQQVPAALAQLRNQPDVRFAESTVPLGNGSRQ
jgi:hypothetical protein